MFDQDRPVVLVADADERLCALLAGQLDADGFETLAAGSVEHLRVHARQAQVDALILGELGQSRIALEVLRAVRAGAFDGTLTCGLPVIVVCSDPGELVLLRSFEAGGDDHVVKPFRYVELRARIRALLRRASGQPARERLRVGAVAIDRTAREVTVHGRRVALTAKEFALLLALAAEPTRVLTKQELLRDVWGFPSAARTRTLDTHACRLRTKLADAGVSMVMTVWGIGYRLLEPLSAPTAPVLREVA